MESTLYGKVALITGASRGIGKAIALRFAKGGAFTYINYVSHEDAARETLEAVMKQGGQAALSRFDVRDEEAVREAFAAIVKDQGRLDILVNNAGIWRGGPAMRVNRETWDTVMGINLWGTYNCCRAAMRPMMKQRWGRIINVSSLIGEAGNSGDSLYAASKAAVIGLTKSLARELGSRNICVNAVAPGLIETDMTEVIPVTVKEELKSTIPLGRLGRPEDVAGVAAFLASEEAGYITGQIVRINGGLYM